MPGDSDRRRVGGAFPGPIVEIQHTEERLVVLVTGDPVRVLWIRMDLETSVCEISCPLWWHQIGQQAVAVLVELLNRLTHSRGHFTLPVGGASTLANETSMSKP